MAYKSLLKRMNEWMVGHYEHRSLRNTTFRSDYYMPVSWSGISDCFPDSGSKFLQLLLPEEFLAFRFSSAMLFSASLLRSSGCCSSWRYSSVSLGVSSMWWVGFEVWRSACLPLGSCVSKWLWFSLRGPNVCRCCFLPFLQSACYFLKIKQLKY